MRNQGAQRVKGLFTALITPFDGEGHVDIGAIDRLIAFQLSKGAEGVYPCGSTGLGPMLMVDERKSVAEAVVSSVAGKIPVVVQVGAADTASSVELAVHAEKIGATAVASLTPFYYKTDQGAIKKHLGAISRSVGIPVFAYNIPQFTGNNLLPATAAELAKTGTISGIKDSCRDYLQLLDLLDMVPDDFVVMNGTEEYGLFAIMSGADGLVSGGASAIPEIFKSMVIAERNGDHTAALSAQKTIQKVKDLVRAGPISAYYEILRQRGIDCGFPRPPFQPMSSESATLAMAGLKDLGLI